MAALPGRRPATRLTTGTFRTYKLPQSNRMSELRYHPFLDTWVITATHRQERTFHPPADYCPLCPTQPGGFPTEIPMSEYDIVVFENKFPSLSPNPPEPAIESTELLPVRPSSGVCEVVCYSQDHNATFATLPDHQVRKLTRVWRDRYVDLSQREGIEYVFIFENKGREIGVTLSHPHGQIYAFPFIPPVLVTELAAEHRYEAQHGRSLWDDWLAEEHAGPRVITQNPTFSAIVPKFARYPYEVWIVARDPIPTLGEMCEDNLDALAEILLTITRAYDRLFGFSMPYIMVMHQHPKSRFHVEFYPPYRTADKLKYLAGSEAGAGAFINDTLPEASAARLRDSLAKR